MGRNARTSTGQPSGRRPPRGAIDEAARPTAAPDVAALLEAAGEAVAVIDADGRLTYANGPAAALLGAAPEDLLGRPRADLLPALPWPPPPGAPAALDLSTADGRPLRARLRPAADGGLLLLLQPAADGPGAVEEEEDGLRASVARFDRALTATNDALFETDLRTNVTYRSPGYLALLGLGLAALTPGIPSADPVDDPVDDPSRTEWWVARVHPDDRARVLSYRAECLQGRHPYHRIEYRLRRENGTYVWVVTRARIEFDADGTPVRMTGVLSDISARKDREEDLRRSEERFRSLVEASADGVWTADGAGAVHGIGENLRAFLGLPVAGGPPDWRAVIYPDDRRRVIAEWDRCRGEGRFYESTYRIRRNDGSIRHVRSRGVPVVNADGTVREWVGTLTDVTERAVSEEALRRSEERYRSLTIATSDGIVVARPDGMLASASPALLTVLGYDVPAAGEAIPALGPADWLYPVHTADRRRLVTVLRRAAGRGRRPTRIAETEFRIRRPERVAPTESASSSPVAEAAWRRWRLRAVPLTDGGGRVREWVVAISDVTEQAEAAEALRRSEAQFRTLIDAMSDGTWTADAAGGITGISAHLARRSDMSVADAEATALGDRWLAGVHPDDVARVSSVWHACVHAAQPFCATYRMLWSPTLPAEGEVAATSYRWMRANAVPMKNEDGTVREWVGALTDIHEQMIAEEALRRSETEFRTLIGAMSDLVWTADARGYITGVTPSPGSAAAAQLGAEWYQHVHVEDTARMDRIWRESMATGLPYRCDYRVLLPARDGGSPVIRHLRSLAVPLRAEEGAVRGWIGSILDVTDQALAEETIRLSEMRLREAQRLTKSGSWHWDVATERVTWSEEMFPLFGRDPAQGVPPIHEIVARFQPEDGDRLDAALDAAEFAGTPFADDFHLINERGAARCFHVIGRAERDAAGAVTALFGTVVDITARKEMEEELRRTQELARRISLAMPDLLYVYDLTEERTVYTNREIVAHLGYGPEDAAGEEGAAAGEEGAAAGDGAPALQSLVHPDDLPRLERIQERLRRARDGQVIETTFRQRHKNGSWRWLHCREMVFTRGEDGAASEILGIAQDITERKEAQDRLKESEERYRSLVGLLSDWVWECGTDGAFTSVSPQVTTPLGYLPTEMVGLQPIDFIHGEDRERVRELLGGVVRRRAPFAGQVVRFVSLLGDAVTMEISGVPLIDAAGVWVGYRGVGRDITRRKLAEDQLRNREEHLTRLIASSPDSIKTLDLAGGLLSMNDAGKALMEIRDLAPYLNQDWVAAWPEGDRARVARVLAEARAGRTGRFEGLLPTATGTPKWWDVVVTPLLGPDGQPELLLAVSRDITAQKSLEEQKDALLAEAIERAERDPLTGLYDHRAFHNRLAEEAARALEDGTSFAVALVDVDNFKYFNDVFGHLEGDGVLLHVAEALRASCRQGDVIGRLGGDEFAILMPGVSRDDAETLLVERFQTNPLVTSWQPRGHDATVPLRLSFGAAVFPGDDQTLRDLLKRADERLYNNKKAGNEGILEPLREELTQLMHGFPMLDALVMAVDSKDRYTKRHSEDVLIYAVMIAQEIGMPEEDLLLLRAAALLHDVGKIGVSAKVLRLPTKLSEEEYEAVKRHAALGAALIEVLLRGQPEWQATIVEAVHHHHEAWDGAGYPDGLAREQIPLMARILAVADAFSALTTDRPYRQGMAPGKALNVLEAGAGTQWDAACVAAFLHVIEPYRDLESTAGLGSAGEQINPGGGAHRPRDPDGDAPALPGGNPGHPDAGEDLKRAA